MPGASGSVMDVFLRWYPEKPVRRYLALAVLERLKLYGDIAVTVIAPHHFPREVDGVPWIGVAPGDYHRESKVVAEILASGTYCVIDDDCLPIGKDYFRIGEEMIGNHTEYGLLASWSVVDLGTPSMCDVLEMHAVGTPYFVRKGVLNFPHGKLEQYDGVLCKAMADQGLKTGLIPKLRHIHAGHGLSQVIPAWWTA